MKTRIYFLTLLLIVLVFEANAQLQKYLTVSDGEGNKYHFLTSQIDSISYYSTDGKYIKDITSNGVVQSFDISENVIMQLDEVDVSGVFVKKDIGEWDEIRYTVEGAILMQKKNSTNSMCKDIVMLLSNKEYGSYLYTIQSDENEVPKYITINDCAICVDRYDEKTIDLTIIYNDTISKSFNGLSWEYNSEAATRAYYENNLERNTAIVLQAGAGAASMLIGRGLIISSVAAEGATAGASTPISAVGVVVGSIAIVGGYQAYSSSVDRFWRPGDNQSSVWGDVAIELVSRGLQSETFAEIFAEMVPDEFSRDPQKTSSLPFLVGIFAKILDYNYGKTVTWKDLKEFYYDKVITGNSSNITKNSAILSGYIDPKVTRSPLDGKRFTNEYGIILNPGQKNSVVTKKVDNGDGGAVDFLFENLRPHTTYDYIAYYYDRTNTIFTHGDTRQFQTLSIEPKITNFKQISSQYSKGKYYNDGRYYDYRFEVSTTVEIESLEGIEDWGYVYKDPHGSAKRISLKEEGTSYTDTRYVYYRNEPKSSVCLYGYVKYEGSDEYIYGDSNDYPLETYDLHVAKYEIDPNAKFENDSVIFNINVQLEGDQESLKECSEFGYYINCNNDLQYFNMSQMSSAYNQIGAIKEYSINGDLFNKIDYNSFVAEATGCKIGAYVVDQSGNHIQLDEKDLTGLIYDRKPSIKFDAISITGNTFYYNETEDKDEIRTSYSESYSMDGTFWMTGSVTSVGDTSLGRHESYKFEGLNLADESITLEGFGWGSPNETTVAYYEFELKNGQTKRSDNSVFFTYGTYSAGIK